MQATLDIIDARLKQLHTAHAQGIIRSVALQEQIKALEEQLDAIDSQLHAIKGAIEDLKLIRGQILELKPDEPEV